MNYAIVQHSGCGYGGKQGFKRGLEVRSVTSTTQLKRVEAAGGRVFSSYVEASNYCESEMFPPGVQGMYPKAPGTFSSKQLDGLKIYVPVRAVIDAAE